MLIQSRQRNCVNCIISGVNLWIHRLIHLVLSYIFNSARMLHCRSPTYVSLRSDGVVYQIKVFILNSICLNQISQDPFEWKWLTSSLPSIIDNTQTKYLVLRCLSMTFFIGLLGRVAISLLYGPHSQYTKLKSIGFY